MSIGNGKTFIPLNTTREVRETFFFIDLGAAHATLLPPLLVLTVQPVPHL